jgi:S1-C subfamily serine protease
MAVLLVAIAVVACSRPLPAQEQSRDHAAQESAHVAIVNACSDGASEPRVTLGRGVVVTSRHVVTAAHVVRCAAVPQAYVMLPTRIVHRAVVIGEDAHRDLALLELAHAGQLQLAKPRIGMARLGAYVCARDKCGAIVDMDRTRFDFTAEGFEGQSGSGVYDDRGALVGIVSGRLNCGGVPCGTRAMRIAGHPYPKGKR